MERWREAKVSWNTKAPAVQVQKKHENLIKKEEWLSADKKKLDTEYELAQRMLKSAEEKLDIVTEKGDMMSVKVAREMIAQANGKWKVQQSIECSTLKLEVA